MPNQNLDAEAGAATDATATEPSPETEASKVEVSLPAPPAAAGTSASPEGAAAEPEETSDGPDPSEVYPMLRPLDAYPMDLRDPNSGAVQKVLVLADPSGIAPGVVKLPPLGAAVIELCDGTRTREQICADFSKQYRTPLSPEALNNLLQKLDDALLLDSTRFRLHCARLFADFAALPTRPARFAGRYYPETAEAIGSTLQAAFGPPHGPALPKRDEAGKVVAGSQPLPRAIVVPTVDVSRAGPAYAWGYRALLDAPRLPSLIVLLGCDHAAHDALVTLTRKHFETPIGTLQTDTALVDAIVGDLKERDEALSELMTRDEAHHRGEHSLEMQVLWLRFLLNWRRENGLASGLPDDAEPRILPVLVGSLHDLAVNPPSRDGKLQPQQTTQIFDEFVVALQRRVGERQQAGETVLWVAASDLAHVGPRFGDAEDVTEGDRDSLERRDQETLKPLLSGDAMGFLGEIRRERDRRHVQGLGALYTFLQAARPTAGKLRCYAQCDAEGASFVSLATVLFP